MKTPIRILLKKLQLLTILILLLTAFHNLSFGQTGKVELTSSCIEYIGDGSGRYVVSLGYTNTGTETVVVEEANSIVTYNNGQSKKYGANTFLPGNHEKIITQEFDASDRVVWTVIMPNGKEKIVSADINSNHCRGIDNITPYYTPPPGGKLKNSKIGTELNALYEKYIAEGNQFSPVSDLIFQIGETYHVFIEVICMSGQSAGLVGELNTLVPTLSASTEDFTNERANYWFPIEHLLELNYFTYLNFARPAYPGVNDVIEGQGDIAMRSDYARLGYIGEQFQLDGSGVRVGVISNSYNTKGQAYLDVEQYDLPGDQDHPYGNTTPVRVLKDIETSPGFSLSDEGRAMLQIVHDVAPGAELVFRTGYLGELDMAAGIRDLANPLDNVYGMCDIIVDDITYITEPFFRDGILSKAIDEVVNNQSVSYFSSAGNFGSNAYQGIFFSGVPFNGISGKAYNFADGPDPDIFQRIRLEAGTYTIVLQWDDGRDPDLQAITDTDMDIYLANNNGSTLLGYNRDNTGGAPIEVLPFTVNEDDVITNILIAKASGPSRSVAFKYVVFRGGMGFHMEEYAQGGSTILGHANAEGTLAVGAVMYDQVPTDESSSINVQEYSSTGGSPIMNYYAEGDVIYGSPETDFVIRSKPDFTAPDGVNTSVNLSSVGGSDYTGDPDNLPNFFGTSAAAPHAAGVAALIIEARNSYDQGNSIAPADIRSLMRSTAIGNNNDFNNRSGDGFIQPYAAIGTFANPKPEVMALEVIQNGATTVIPGETMDPIQFKIKGNFFVKSNDPLRKSKVLFRGQPLTEDIVTIENEQTIIVNHPGFLGNPEIRVENPPIAIGPETDGGVSVSIKFSDTPKQKVTITALDFLKKYGETLPDFSTVILPDPMNSDAFHNATVDYNDFSTGEMERILERLSFEVNATATSNVANYDILLVFEDADPLTELDLAIDEKYEIETKQAHLTVHKLDLKITPMDVTLGYGQTLTQNLIDFDYDLISDNISNADLDIILADLKHQYTNPLPLGIPLVNGISLVRGTAMVNVPEEEPILVEVEDNGDIYLYSGAARVLYENQILPRGVALVNDLPFVQIEEIIDGAGMFNGKEIFIEKIEGESYLTAIKDEQGIETLTVPIAVENGLAFVRGTALVNGIEVSVDESGNLLVNGAPVTGTALVNGIAVVRGTALVNSEHIITGTALVNQFVRGTALVNEIEIPVKNGIPNVGANAQNPIGIAMVNGIPVRGTALVNGQFIRGTALVNGLDVSLDETGTLFVNGAPVTGTALVNGLAYVRGTALVNGESRVIGTALVNGQNLVRGVALVNGVAEGLDLTNMNFLASTNAIGTLNFVNGTALVNGLVGVDAAQVEAAASPLTNSFTSVRGIALVNGQVLVTGTALVNGDPVLGTALVNEAISNEAGEESNLGAIMINHEAEESSSYIPVTFITGTDATPDGTTHKIVPGTFLSNNFKISYGLGNLTISQATLEIAPEADQSKVYGEDDPDFRIGSYILDGINNDADFDGTIAGVNLYGSDAMSGALTRTGAGDPAMDHVDSYGILQGDLTAGDNYKIEFTDNILFEITERTLMVGATAKSRAYDGSFEAEVTLSHDGLGGDILLLDYTSASFEDKDAGLDKIVNITGIEVSGDDALNYTWNTSATASANIYAKVINYIYMTPDGPHPLLKEGDLAPSFNNLETLFEYRELVANEVLMVSEFSILKNELPYDWTSSESAGVYEIIPIETDPNYEFDHDQSIPGELWVNPNGPGTRAIRPVLNCVEEMDDYFIANFAYKNDNPEDVYIPVGEDNNLSGSGDLTFWTTENEPLDHQPEIFKSGGGFFKVRFDGNQLNWVVNSLDEDHKASNAANANSNSTKCGSNLKSTNVSSSIEVEDQMEEEDLLVYPNPVTSKVSLVMKDIEHYTMLQVLDLTGKVHPITSIKKRSDRLEIDMSDLASGAYFIKVIMEDNARVVPVIKQ